MKTLGRLKTLWTALCVLFSCLALYNFMMPDSYSDQNLIFRLFYIGLAVLFAVASLSFRAFIKALEEIRDKNI